MKDAVIVKLQGAYKLLAECDTIQKAKKLIDIGTAALVYAKRRKEGQETVDKAREFTLNSERLLGQMLKETERAKGSAGRGRPKKGTSPKEAPKSETPTLAEMGVSEKLSSDAQMLASLPDEEFEKVVSGVSTIKHVRAEIKHRKRQAIKTPPLPKGKYRAIVIDPPWDTADEGDVDQMGRAQPEYPVMSFETLLELPVIDLAHSDAHIYLWITNRSMPKGADLLTAWGFRHITILTWPKTHFGTGNYFRGQTEHVVFGVRGSLALKRKDAATLLPTWKRGPKGHSSKPPEFLKFVETCSPGPYLEMFARDERKGWTMWGSDTCQ